MEHTVSKKVSPIPRGYRTATPCLTVFDIDAAIAFYQAAFGAEILSRQYGADAGVALQATIKVGNSIIVLNREAPELGMLSPASLGASVSQIHLYVNDVDMSWERAVEAGAQVVTPLYDAYWGDRTGTLVDGNGYLWSIASKIENVSQEEIRRRAAAWHEGEASPYLEEAALDPAMVAPLEVLVADETLADDNVAV